MANFVVQQTLVNPTPEIQPTYRQNMKVSTNEWSLISVSVHGITPDHVRNSPKVGATLQKAWRYITVNNKIQRVIIVAHNSPFDQSRYLLLHLYNIYFF